MSIRVRPALPSQVAHHWRDRYSGGLALGVTSGVLIVVITISDWPLGTLSAFWANHSMLTNIVSSALFLLLGATIVERWLARQELQKYKTIEQLAFSSIGQAPLAVRRTLWFLLNGEPRPSDRIFAVAESDKASLRRIFERHSLMVVTEKDVDSKVKSTPSDVERILLLISDFEWQDLSYNMIRRVIGTSRSLVAEWAPLMIASRESSDVLKEVSAVIDDAQYLREELNPDRHDAQAPSPAAVSLLWRTCFVNAAVVYEDIAAFAYRERFRRWSGGLVQPEDVKVLASVGVYPDTTVRGRVARVYTASHQPKIVLPPTAEPQE